MCCIIFFQDLQTFVESAEHGVIYFSFGSLINSNHLPKEKMNIFLVTIEQLKQKVILKWIPDGSIKLSQNVLTGSWFPQSDILGKYMSVHCKFGTYLKGSDPINIFFYFIHFTLILIIYCL